MLRSVFGFRRPAPQPNQTDAKTSKKTSFGSRDIAHDTVTSAVEAGATYQVDLVIEAENESGKPPALVQFKFLDVDGAPLTFKIAGMSQSQRFGHFRYVGKNAAAGSVSESLEFTVPAGAKEIELGLFCWMATSIRVVAPMRLRQIEAADPAANAESKALMPKGTRPGLSTVARAVEPGETYEVLIDFAYITALAPNAALVSIAFEDASGALVAPINSVPVSNTFGPYRYLEAKRYDPEQRLLTAGAIFTAPSRAVMMRATVHPWKSEIPFSIAATRIDWLDAPDELWGRGELAVGDAPILLSGALRVLDQEGLKRGRASIPTDASGRRSLATIDCTFYAANGDVLSRPAIGPRRSVRALYFFDVLDDPDSTEARDEIPCSAAFVPPTGAVRLRWRLYGPGELYHLLALARPLEDQRLDAQAALGLPRLPPSAVAIEPALQDRVAALCDDMIHEPVWQACLVGDLDLVGAVFTPVESGIQSAVHGSLRGADDPAAAKLAIVPAYFDEWGRIVRPETVYGCERSKWFGLHRPLALRRDGNGTVRFDEAFLTPERAKAAAFLVCADGDGAAVEVSGIATGVADVAASFGLRRLAPEALSIAAPVAERLDGIWDRLVEAPVWKMRSRGRISLIGAAFDCATPNEWAALDATVTFPDHRGPSRLFIHPVYFDEAGVPLAAQPFASVWSDQVGYYRYPALRPLDDRTTRIAEGFLAPAGAVTAAFFLFHFELAAPATVSGLATRPTTLEAVCDALEPAHMDEAQLKQAVKIADMAWHLPARRAIYAALHVVAPKESSYGRRARVLTGQMIELDPRWLPSVPAAAPYVPDPAAILHLFKGVYPDESSGGAVRSRNIVAAQAANGYRPLVCLPVNAPSQDRAAAEAAGRLDALPVGVQTVERDGVTLNYLSFPSVDAKTLYAPNLLSFEAALHARAARQQRVSLVHAASGFRGYELALKGRAVARACGLPFVYEVRSFHEHAWRPLDRTDACDNVTHLRMRQENACMQAADAVVTISEAMIEQLVARGVPREKIFLAPNSIEDAFKTPHDATVSRSIAAELGIKSGPVVGYISNFSQREGQAVLLEAFAKAVARGLDANLLLVGEGPERAKLIARATALGVRSRAHFPGGIDHQQIKEWYGVLDLMIVPRIADFASDYVTPLKPFEAMALGIPLLMSDRPVTREIVGANEERGGMFPSNDSMALSDALMAALADPAALRSRAERAQHWVLAERVWSRTVKVYDSVYEYARAAHARKTSSMKDAS